MAPTCLPIDDNTMTSHQHRTQLLQLARQSIKNGLQQGKSLSIQKEDYDQELCELRSSFVTLHLNGRLRGCIGNLQAHRELIKDVVENAFLAAFKDPRFEPLKEAEFDKLAVEISVLTPVSEMSFKSEQDLIDQLTPGKDGLILKDGRHRGTFLPSVWEQLPDPQTFLRHLKRKAGLAEDYWSDKILVCRYHTESFN